MPRAGIVIPTRYRSILSEYCQGRVVITVDSDPCLLLYPLPEWEKIQQALISLPILICRPGSCSACCSGTPPTVRWTVMVASCCRQRCAAWHGWKAHLSDRSGQQVRAVG